MSAAQPSNQFNVQVMRGGRVESTHIGLAAVCDAAGNVVLDWGAKTTTYMRSSAKPFQAIASLRLGSADKWQFTSEEIALICASHGAQPPHLQHVESILHKTGLSLDALQCGTHDPFHRPSAKALRQTGTPITALHNNCSGKHAGMLAACLAKNWPTQTYLQPDHPLQREIQSVMQEFTGASEQLHVGVDGCGVPSFYTSLQQAATAFAKLSQPISDTHQATQHVVEAMQSHPLLVSYEGAYNTIFSETLGPKTIAKGGAEGIYCFALTELGLGVACKVADGHTRALPRLVLAVLEKIAPDLAKYPPLQAQAFTKITNAAGKEVGEIR